MRRVIHLLDHGTNPPTRKLITVLAEGLKPDHPATILTIGRGGDLRGVWTASLHLRAQAGGALIHTWSIPALLAAALAGDRAIIHGVVTEMSAGGWNWLRWIGRRSDVTVVLTSEAAREFAIGRGIGREKCRVIRPGLECSKGVRDEALREKLRLSPDDFVILAPGESTRSARHSLAVWTAAILYELDPRWKLLIWGRGDQAAGARRLGLRTGHPELIRIAPQWECAQLMNVADVALITALPVAPGPPLAQCMAAGLPIVGTENEILTDRSNALLNNNDSPRELAQKLMEIRADAELRSMLGRMAQSDAVELFDSQKFLDQYAEVYSGLSVVSPRS